jgi:hypothetical protein
VPPRALEAPPDLVLWIEIGARDGARRGPERIGDPRADRRR